MDIGTVSGVLTNGSSAAQKEVRSMNEWRLNSHSLCLQAFDFFERLKESPTGWRICVENLAAGDQDESREFFCLLVIESYIKTR